jgi:hypothetical protein
MTSLETSRSSQSSSQVERVWWSSLGCLDDDLWLLERDLLRA